MRRAIRHTKSGKYKESTGVGLSVEGAPAIGDKG
jgi:hypothetical protein